MAGFKKDIDICLAGAAADSSGRITYAYLPALMSCCATLEYLADLFLGRNNSLSKGDIQQYANRFMPQPDYDTEAIRILWELFRNGVAHHGITSGVWKDMKPANLGRRLTWDIVCEEGRAIEVRAQAGKLMVHPPWPTSYTHRAIIRLPALSRDVAMSAELFIQAFDEPMLANFYRVMRKLYPKDGLA